MQNIINKYTLLMILVAANIYLQQLNKYVIIPKVLLVK